MSKQYKTRCKMQTATVPLSSSLSLNVTGPLSSQPGETAVALGWISVSYGSFFFFFSASAVKERERNNLFWVSPSWENPTHKKPRDKKKRRRRSGRRRRAACFSGCYLLTATAASLCHANTCRPSATPREKSILPCDNPASCMQQEKTPSGRG